MSENIANNDFSFISKISTPDLKRALKSLEKGKPLEDINTYLAAIEILQAEIYLREGIQIEQKRD